MPRAVIAEELEQSSKCTVYYKVGVWYRVGTLLLALH